MIEYQYPIGKFKAKDSYTEEEISNNIERITSLPSRLENEVKSLDDSKLDTPYREGGWTVRQVIHHLADSHLNAYVRTKWTLTEDSPTIKAYNEKLWATTPEVAGDPALSIALLKAHHQKWVSLLKKLTPADLEKYYIHPETQRQVRLANVIALYAWHCDHHLAHITKLKERSGWK